MSSLYFSLQLMERLHVACVQYNDWKASNNPGFKPWLHPEQNLLPLVSPLLYSAVLV